MNRLLEYTVPSTCQQLDAIFWLVDAARLGKLAHGDRMTGIDAAIINPLLNAIEVDWS